MWAIIESNTVKEILRGPKSLTIEEVKYPQNIFSTWSNSELAEIGIVPVTIDNSNFKNQEYYINTNITYTYDTETKTVTGTYGTATAKALDDSGSGEGLVKGLKSMRKEDINSQARNILEQTDWMVIREADGGEAVPSNIKTYRASVRTKSNEMCTKIDEASDVDALAALYSYSGDPLVRPLGEFPVL